MKVLSWAASDTQNYPKPISSGHFYRLYSNKFRIVVPILLLCIMYVYIIPPQRSFPFELAPYAVVTEEGNAEMENVVIPGYTDPMDVSQPTVVAVVKVVQCSGTGNQLFTYAAGYAFARSLGIPLLLEFQDASCGARPFVLHLFNIPKSQIVNSTDLQTYLAANIVTDVNEFTFQSTIDEVSEKRNQSCAEKTCVFVFHEYFQILPFFNAFREELAEILSLEKYMTERKTKLQNNATNLLERITSVDSVAVHVRLGDYVGTNHHTPLPVEYYMTAMEKVNQIRPTAHFFVFSDSIEEAENEFIRVNLTAKFSITFVTREYGLEATDEFYIIGKCKDFIIPNSTFSWWAAYLNSIKNGTIVIAPFPRFPKSDFEGNNVRLTLEEKYPLYPPEWILINPWEPKPNRTRRYVFRAQ